MANNNQSAITRLLIELWQMKSQRSKIIGLILVFLAIGLATSLVYLIRGGSAGVMNWPVNFNLSNSDNGVLYQFASDVFRGRQLDWSFSPQIYVFPEIPISIVAYLLSVTNVYTYFLLVAIINNLVLFGSIFLLVTHLLPHQSQRQQLERSITAFFPLLILPFLSSEGIFQYHLFPTYYIGVYLMLLLMPVFFLTNKKWLKLTIAIAYILTSASNPLVLIFTIPGMLITLVLRYLKHGAQDIIRPVFLLLSLAVVALLLRASLFSPLVGTGASSYISISSFAHRLQTIHAVYTYGFTAKFDKLLLIGVAVCLISAIVLWFYNARRYFNSNNLDESHIFVRIYLLSLPFTGTIALFGLLALHQYYLWATVVGVSVIVLIVMPMKASSVKVLTYTAVLFLALGTLNPASLHRAYLSQTNYFNYQPKLTQCMDKHIPENGIGYATFSDARHYGLTSKKNLLLIQVSDSLVPVNWLTNTSYSRTLTGNFFVVNPKTQEKPIRGEYVVGTFGKPTRIISCGDASLYFYNSRDMIRAIRDYYDLYKG